MISGLSSDEDHTITLDTDTHKLLIGGHLKLFDAIESGQIESNGDYDDLKRWMAYLDPFDIDLAYVED